MQLENNPVSQQADFVENIFKLIPRSLESLNGQPLSAEQRERLNPPKIIKKKVRLSSLLRQQVAAELALFFKENKN